MRELASSVAVLFSNRSSADICQKAACCACKMIAIDFDLSELFISSLMDILTFSTNLELSQPSPEMFSNHYIFNNGLSLSSCHLLEALLINDSDLRFSEYHTCLMKTLLKLADINVKQFLKSGHFSNPFLIYEIFKCLSFFPASSLYECADTIKEMFNSLSLSLPNSISQSAFCIYSELAKSIIRSVPCGEILASVTSLIIKFSESPDENIRY